MDIDISAVIEDLQNQVSALRRTVETQQSTIDSLTAAVAALAERAGNGRR